MYDATVDPLLQIFLRRPFRHASHIRMADGTASVKHLVEALGIPHTEVGAVRIQGEEVSFADHPEPGSVLDIQGVIPPLDVTCASRLRPHPFPGLRFVVDVNVGRLAHWLRLLGLDAAFFPGMTDGEIARVAEQEQRVVLSRDIQLMKRRNIQYGRLIRNRMPEGQFQEVCTFFGLQGPFDLFTRCLHCNTPLAPLPKDQIRHRLQPKTRLYYDAFAGCETCGRIYWPGSHLAHMRQRLQHIGLAPPTP